MKRILRADGQRRRVEARARGRAKAVPIFEKIVATFDDMNSFSVAPARGSEFSGETELSAEKNPAEARQERKSLLAPADQPEYSPEELIYSTHVRERLIQLLRGETNRLELVTKYHQEPDRLGVLPAPRHVDPHGLRLPIAEEILESAIRFLFDGSEAGPVAQSVDESRGLIFHTRDFPSRFPHIVLQRTDAVGMKDGAAVSTNWSAKRLQNQQNSLQTNRTLDVLALGVDLLKLAL